MTLACALLCACSRGEPGDDARGEKANRAAGEVRESVELPTSDRGSEDGNDLLRFATLDEIREHLASLRGRIVVLDCWSTSCEPCIREFPRLVALAERHAGEGVACLSLSFDFEGIGTPEEVADPVCTFLRERNAAGLTNFLCRDEADALYAAFDIPSIPAVLVYDRSGAIAEKFDSRSKISHPGGFNYDDVQQAVARLLSAGQ